MEEQQNIYMAEYTQLNIYPIDCTHNAVKYIYNRSIRQNMKYTYDGKYTYKNILIAKYISGKTYTQKDTNINKQIYIEISMWSRCIQGDGIKIQKNINTVQEKKTKI